MSSLNSGCDAIVRFVRIQKDTEVGHKPNRAFAFVCMICSRQSRSPA